VERKDGGLRGRPPTEPESVYKGKSIKAGSHLARPYSQLVAGILKIYGRGHLAITNVVLCNGTEQQAPGESATAKLLPGLRVICQKVFRHLHQLVYDKQPTLQLLAMAKKVKARSKPMCELPVDLATRDNITTFGVWGMVVKRRRSSSLWVGKDQYFGTVRSCWRGMAR
jgi:hypothetical protein